MSEKNDVYVKTNGRSGLCSCGKKANFVEIEFINQKGNVQVDSLNCCAECFMKGGFVQSRFFQILGISDDAIGKIVLRQ